MHWPFRQHNVLRVVVGAQVKQGIEHLQIVHLQYLHAWKHMHTPTGQYHALDKNVKCSIQSDGPQVKIVPEIYTK